MIELSITATWGKEWCALEPPQCLADLMRAQAIRAPRRSNRLMQMAHMGALGCISAAGRPPEQGMGLIIGSSHGNLADTLEMMQGVLEAQLPPMPFDFINVSTNMAGYQAASALGLTGGPGLMVSRGNQSLAAALELCAVEPTRPWLVGIVEEAPLPLAEHRRRLNVHQDTPLAECTYWFRLETGDAPAMGRMVGLDRLPDIDALRARLSDEGHLGNRPLVCLGEAARARLTSVSTLTLEPDKTETCAMEDEAAGYHLGHAARQVSHFLTSARPGDTLHQVDWDPVCENWLVLTFRRDGEPTDPAP